MTTAESLLSLYEKLGAPCLSNFMLEDLGNGARYHLGAFVLADRDDCVVLIRRTPIAGHPGIEDYWWIPGGGREQGEVVEDAAIREFQEETGLSVSVDRVLLAQRATDRPFIAVFFRGTVIDGTASAGSDPDESTAEVRAFLRGEVPLERLWSDADRILLVQEGFAEGSIEDLIVKNGFRPNPAP